jgi:tetratricopeptide (TPR) repeat protein
MQRRDFRRAAALLEKGLTLDGDRAAFLVKLAEARIELNELDAARSALEEAIKTKNDQAMAHYNLALVLEARGDSQGAAAEYKREIAISPSLYQPHFNLAKLHSRAGRGGEAIAEFRAAVEANPAFGTGWLYLGKALLDAGELKGAEQAALRGLQSSPDPAMLPLGHYVLADVYSRLGREADAARQAAAGQKAERATAAGRL